MSKYKLAILTAHPIQYQAPLFRKLSENPKIDLTVYFNWNFGVDKPSYDSGFGKEIKWDIPVLEGYNFNFLKNYSFKPSSNFWGQINFGIISEIIKGKYDAIIIFGWNSFSNWLAFLTAFIIKTSVILRAESPLNQEILKAGWKLKFKKIILGTLFKFISGFLYIGEENRKFYQFYGVPENKLFFAPYAVDNDRFIKEATSDKRQAIRNKLGMGKKDIVVLFVGKLIGKKRPIDLLKAYKNLENIKTQEHKSIHLIFVGDGALRPELEKYAEENNFKNVHFVGFKNQTELPEYYSIADIFVLPSGLGETWGLVVNEAMCFGLSIIVSDKVGCGKDLVEKNENGFIFPEGNIELLKKYLEILVTDDIKREFFGKKSFEIVKDYSYKKDIDGILKVLEDINNR